MIEPPPPNSGDQEITNGEIEAPAKRVLCHEPKCRGKYKLAATKDIAAGTRILSDVFVYAIAPDPSSNADEFESSVKHMVHNNGSKFTRRYLDLPHSEDNGTGLYTAIWSHNRLPFDYGSARGDLVAPKMACVNHSCLPNAHLSLMIAPVEEFEYDDDNDGSDINDSSGNKAEKRKDTSNSNRTVCRAVLYACMDIPKGAEITIAYDYRNTIMNPAPSRQLYSSVNFNFRCACSFCIDPDEGFEYFIWAYHKALWVLDQVDMVDRRPAFVLMTAHNVLEGYEQLETCDIREALIWRQCAVIAAHHSDIGRAIHFIYKAEACFRRLEGPFGFHCRQMLNWQDCPANIPGFGATTRGLSGRDERKIISQSPAEHDKILFMLDHTKPGDYIRLGCYRQSDRGLQILTDAAAFGGSSGSGSGSGSGKKRKKRKPKDKNSDVDEEENEKINKHSKKLERHNCTRRQSKTDQCIDPEKDFLDIIRQLVGECQEENPTLLEPVQEQVECITTRLARLTREWRWEDGGGGLDSLD